MNWINFAGKNLAQTVKRLRQRMGRIGNQQKSQQRNSQKLRQANGERTHSNNQKGKVQNLNATTKLRATQQGQNLRKMGVSKASKTNHPSKPSNVPDVRPKGNYEPKNMQKSRGQNRGKGIDL